MQTFNQRRIYVDENQMIEFYTRGGSQMLYRYYYTDRWYWDGYDLEGDYMKPSRHGYSHISLSEMIDHTTAKHLETQISKEEYDEAVEEFRWNEIK